MAGRTFVVSVTASPPRVVVEDVQGRRHAVAADLADAAQQIGRWLTSVPAPAVTPGAEEDDD